MFSPEVIARREREVTHALGSLLPTGKLQRHSLDECWSRKESLADAMSPKGEPLRVLTQDEEAFIFHERLVCKLDYRYCTDRYAVIAKETGDAEPITPRWKSQEVFLQTLANLEQERLTTGNPDGLLLNLLKARQLGCSTESEVLLAHRLLTQTGLRGMVAGDVPEQSKYLFGMAELVVENVPWWLRPQLLFHQAGSYLQFATGTSLRAAAGKSQRGGLQDKGGAKGNIGRGKTYNGVHISEVSTWERPEQLYDGLLPGVPRRSRTLCIFESTAKGRNNEWHQHWLASGKGLTRFTNVFIPWYIEPDKYWAPPPSGWEPSPEAKAHAAMVEADSPKWCFGQTIRLPREQLFWWEHTRAEFDARDELAKFKEEFPATDLEAFQHAGQSVFSARTLDRLVAQAKSPIAVLHVRPAKDLAQLKQHERTVGVG